MWKVESGKNSNADEELQVHVRQAVPIPFGSGSGEFFSFHNLSDQKEHFAVGFGLWREQETPLVRLHSECLTGEIFKSNRCECGDQLGEAIDRFHLEGGLLVYLRQEGRGIGLYNKLDAYALQLEGADTFLANRMLGFADDLRTYDIAAEMLKALNVKRLRLLTNNPEKVTQLRASGIEVQQISTGVFLKEENHHYLKTKIARGHHGIHLESHR